jgi:hypothetical protein
MPEAFLKAFMKKRPPLRVCHPENTATSGALTILQAFVIICTCM